MRPASESGPRDETKHARVGAFAFTLHVSLRRRSASEPVGSAFHALGSATPGSMNSKREEALGVASAPNDAGDASGVTNGVAALRTEAAPAAPR